MSSYKKWLTPVLIVIGAVCLLASLRIKESVNPILFQVLGITALMFGIFRASKVVQSKSREDD